jgi:predicted small integral membrane protein
MRRPLGHLPILMLVALMLGALVALWTLAPRGDNGIDATAPMIPGGWMAWTFATALFFWVIAALLLTFTVLAINFPERPRRGILRIDTTRGDRLFISLLGSAFLCAAWLATFGAPLWGALLLCLVYAAAVFRWV